MKDSYWFKHDSNASSDMKLMKLKHIYDFWGIGLYWCMIEFLRQQDNYEFQSDGAGMEMVCDLVRCSDKIRFSNWFKDCLKFGLFIDENGVFFSSSLKKRMECWELKKNNGLRGGRPKNIVEKITEMITETETEIKPELEPDHKAKQKHKIREEKIREDKIREDKNKYFVSENLNKIFLDFLLMRKKIKKPATDKAIELLISKLNELSNDDEIKTKIIEQSIINSWQGLFQLKDENKIIKPQQLILPQDRRITKDTIIS